MSKHSKSWVKRKRFFTYPYCEMCDKELILHEAKRHESVPDNAAVLLSLWTKYTPTLRQHYSRWRLVCRGCADKWSDEQQRNVDIEERRERSNKWPGVAGYFGA